MGELGVALAGTPRFDGEEGHQYPSSTLRHQLLPAPCHFCGGPSWLTDEIGAVHPCCVLEWTREGGCLACQTSDRLNKDHRRRVLTGQNRNASLSPYTKGEPPLTESEI